MFSNNVLKTMVILNVLNRSDVGISLDEICAETEFNKEEVMILLSKVLERGIVSDNGNAYKLTPIFYEISIFDVLKVVDNGAVFINVNSHYLTKIENREVEMKLSMIETFSKRMLEEIKLKQML